MNKIIANLIPVSKLKELSPSKFNSPLYVIHQNILDKKINISLVKRGAQIENLNISSIENNRLKDKLDTINGQGLAGKKK